MGLFGRRKESIASSGLTRGLVDWHSHILPGVDDGIQTMEQSLAVLDEYGKMGFKTVWLTPHVMEDMPNTTDALRQQFEQIKAEYSGDITLRLASENMLDNLFIERLEANDFLPYGTEGRHLLVETSYMSAPSFFNEVLDQIKQKGYIPVLAHPERYIFLDEKGYENLMSRGIQFQLNLFSLLGGYGNTVRKKAYWLLSKMRNSATQEFSMPSSEEKATPITSNRAITLVGSDLHSLRQASYFNRAELSSKEIEQLKAITQNK